MSSPPSAGASARAEAPAHRPWTAAVVVFLVVLVYATVAALQILVWNPLAAVPGRELAQIRSSMAAADEDLHIAPVVGVLGFGVVLTAVLLIFMLRGRAASFDVGLLGLGLLALGAVAYFWASFNAGMSLADAFGISGRDYAPWGGVLTRISAAALVVLVAASAWRGLRAGVRRR